MTTTADNETTGQRIADLIERFVEARQDHADAVEYTYPPDRQDAMRRRRDEAKSALAAGIDQLATHPK